MESIDTKTARQALLSVDTEKTREIAQNADLLAMFVGVMNGSLAALEGNVSAALGFVDKTATVADVAGKVANNQTVRVSAASTQLITQTLSLLKLSSTASPGAVVATVGAIFTKKVALAFGLAEDNKQAKLIGATADILSSVLTVGLAAAELSTPVGWVLLIGAAAQLGVSSYQGYIAVQSQ